jgi:DNA-directed RNA polymerase beta subunit
MARNGFLEASYRRVHQGVATRDIEWLSAMEEDRYYIAQASAKLNDDGSFADEQVSCRRQGDYTTRGPRPPVHGRIAQTDHFGFRFAHSLSGT